MSQIHREHPEASPEEIDALQRAALLGINQRIYGDYRRYPTPSPTITQEERTCRDCGTTFIIRKTARHNKWGSLCSYCLANEI